MPDYAYRFRLDWDCNGGRIMTSVCEDIRAKLLSAEVNPTESMIFKLSFHFKNDPQIFIVIPVEITFPVMQKTFRKRWYLYSAHYDNLLLLGDFNVSFWNPVMEDICTSYGFKSLIAGPTYFKNSDNSSCIDMILTNTPYIFQHYFVLETGLTLL